MTEQPADSAGQEWGGRSLSSTGFDDDSGAADAALGEALAADPRDEQLILQRLAGARLIVPIVAAPGEIDESGDLAVEKSTDMAVVTLTAPDGQRALPVFTSIAALATWDASARPSPVTSAKAAQAAVSERCDVMVLDLGGEQTFVLRPSMLWALAQEQTWLPAYADPFVQQAISRAVAEEDEIVSAVCEDGSDVDAGVLRVSLTLVPGLSSETVQALATRVGERIATDGETRARVDSLAFSISSAS